MTDSLQALVFEGAGVRGGIVRLGATWRAVPERRGCWAAGALIRRLFHEEDIRVFPERPVCLRCSCSRERVISMLRMLGPGEVRRVVGERAMVEVACEFCNRRYAFDRVDVEQMFASGVVTGAQSTRH
jgi:molecular chaperone Hsp33